MDVNLSLSQKSLKEKALKESAVNKRAVNNKKLNVVLCWHMHQPDYRDHRNGEYQQPWVYLHAIKDYIDMLVHLEKTPNARAVINFSPVLLEQIDDYTQQISAFLHDSHAITDPLLAALAETTLPADFEQRHFLIRSCLKANETHLIKRFSAFKRLTDMSNWLIHNPDEINYLNNQYLTDLLVWYHLAWLGETVRRNNTVIQKLIEKAGGFTLLDRRSLLSVIGELLGSVIERYRRLALQQRIELSITPYGHPMMPLLFKLSSAREALPEVRLPLMEHYPDGAARAAWHVQQGIDTFTRYFGFAPQGCWPAEGGLCAKTLALLDSYGFKWTASGGNVLKNSLLANKQSLPENSTANKTAYKKDYLYQNYQLENNVIRCFFRDDELSDLIGFTYADWHGDDAVANFMAKLEKIADQRVTDNATADSTNSSNSDSVVSIILDGENAWEYYPENAYYFLEALYQRLSDHPNIHLTTFSSYLNNRKDADSHKILPSMVAGSWVYGSFSTWIGDEQKNRAWDMLGDAKQCFDRVVASGRLSKDQLLKAQAQLAACEGSDWFWWFGDDNPSDTVSEFEHLYRLHLTNLYQLLDEPPPTYLPEVFTHASGLPIKGGKPIKGGVMRPSNE